MVPELHRPLGRMRFPRPRAIAFLLALVGAHLVLSLVAAEYLQGALPPSALVTRAAVFGFDGETPVGQVRLLAAADDLASAPGLACLDAQGRR